MRLGTQPFLWKWDLFAWDWKMISISKAYSTYPRFETEAMGNIVHHLETRLLLQYDKWRLVTRGVAGKGIFAQELERKRLLSRLSKEFPLNPFSGAREILETNSHRLQSLIKVLTFRRDHSERKKLVCLKRRCLKNNFFSLASRQISD